MRSGIHAGKTGDAKNLTPTLVMTALMEEAAFLRFDGLRQLHFPTGRYKVPAHISVFHTLPSHALALISDITRVALSSCPNPNVSVTGVRFLGRGVAYGLDAVGLVTVRSAIASACAEWLTPQDRQSFHPHITVQNKADPVTARALFDALSAEFQPTHFLLTGVRLWNYLDGFWSEVATFEWPTNG